MTSEAGVVSEAGVGTEAFCWAVLERFSVLMYPSCFELSLRTGQLFQLP